MMRAIESLIHFIGSSINVGSDAINSLDMIGHNASRKVQDGFQTVGDSIFNQLRTYNSNYTNFTILEDREDVIWGTTGMVLLFLPGIPFLIANGFAGPVKNTVVALGAFLCFPVALLLIQLLSMCGGGQQYLQSLIAVETVFQCFPQLVLQFFIILYDYPITPLLLVAIISSLTVLFKNAIVNDKESVTFEGWEEIIKYFLRTLPIVVTLVIFRVGSYSILLAYLRFWAVLPISLLFIELCFLAWFFIDYGVLDSVIASIMNIGMMNMGKWWRDTDVNLSIKMAWLGDWNLSRDMKFIKWSSILIYCHLAITMAILMVLVNMDPQMFSHWPSLILHPDDCEKYNFNTICGNILAAGFVNLLLLRF